MSLPVTAATDIPIVVEQGLRHPLPLRGWRPGLGAHCVYNDLRIELLGPRRFRALDDLWDVDRVPQLRDEDQERMMRTLGDGGIR